MSTQCAAAGLRALRMQLLTPVSRRSRRSRLLRSTALRTLAPYPPWASRARRTSLSTSSMPALMSRTTGTTAPTTSTAWCATPPPKPTRARAAVGYTTTMPPPQAGLVEAHTGHEALGSVVQSLTAADLDRTVFHPKRHVLVEFYAPWCGPRLSRAPGPRPEALMRPVPGAQVLPLQAHRPDVRTARARV